MIADNKDRKSSGQWTVNSGQSSNGRFPGSALRDQLRIARAPLPTFNCPLPTVHCPLSTVHDSLPSGRSGATLLEVLVAIFVMGIGLLALLVLFPLGALSMAQAIQSERAAQAAVAASAIANVKDLRRDTAIYNPIANPIVDYYYNDPARTTGKADLDRKSYPVLLDPVGYRNAFGLAAQTSVGGGAAGTADFLLRRTSASFAAANIDVYRWFTFQDDIVFDKFGNAQLIQQAAPPPTIERDVRYSTAYLLQRPRTADPAVVHCTVVVYSGRPTGLSGNLDLAEYRYNLYDNASKTPEVAFDPTNNMIRIRYAVFGKSPPPIRRGNWVLDVSYVGSDPHGYFYRIAGVSEGSDALGAYVDLETQQPLRSFTAVTDTSGGARLLFLEGVAEVFERGLGKEPARNP